MRICKALESNSFKVPAPEHVEGFADKLPYVTVVDEGLPLKPHQMLRYFSANRQMSPSTSNIDNDAVL